MTEIVDRLRAHHGSAYMCQDCYGTTMDDAADEIDRLTAENERLLTDNESLKLTLIELRANPSLRLADDAFQQQAVNSEEGK